jgi:hypothetical protein
VVCLADSSWFSNNLIISKSFCHQEFIFYKVAHMIVSFGGEC